MTQVDILFAASDGPLSQMGLLTAVFAGIGLSAAAGFRVFVPLLVLSVAGRSGLIPLNDDFAWVTSDVALAVFATATAAEIGAYYVPWVDNLLDTLATPAAMISGTVMTAAVMPEVHPALQWIIAAIAGGGTAGTVQLGTVVTRAASTATSGGIANPAVSTAEAGGATLVSILALFIPVILGVTLIAVIVFILWRMRRSKRQPPG